LRLSAAGWWCTRAVPLHAASDFYIAESSAGSEPCVACLMPSSHRATLLAQQAQHRMRTDKRPSVRTLAPRPSTLRFPSWQFVRRHRVDASTLFWFPDIPRGSGHRLWLARRPACRSASQDQAGGLEGHQNRRAATDDHSNSGRDRLVPGSGIRRWTAARPPVKHQK
jgi:hypothetical protein